MSEITQEELLSLLKASHFDEVVHEEVISKKHLENLLDRSDLYTVWEAHNSGKGRFFIPEIFYYIVWCFTIWWLPDKAICLSCWQPYSISMVHKLVLLCSNN